MGRRRRHFESDKIYFITNRCAGERFLLRPDPETIRIITGALCKYAENHKIEVIAFCFLGNHFHLMVRSLGQNIDQFMCDLQSRISWELGDLLPWYSSFFPKPYRAQPILDRAEQIEKLRYILCNAHHHGLVEHPSDWPGLSSWEMHRTGGKIEGTWVNYTECRYTREEVVQKDIPIDELESVERHELELTPLPAFKDMTTEEGFAALFRGSEISTERLIDRVADEAGAAELGRAERQELTAQRTARQQAHRRILGTPVTGRPDNPADAPNPLCLTSLPNERAKYTKRYRKIMKEYDRKARLWRQGVEGLQFPPGTFPPGRLRPVGTPIPDRLRERAMELGISAGVPEPVPDDG